MCGLCGIMYKKAVPESTTPIGAHLVQMLDSMVHRGADSTGVTIAGESGQGDFIVRLCAESGNSEGQLSDKVGEAITRMGGTIKSTHCVDEYMRFAVDYDGDPQVLAEQLLLLEGIEIHSIGRNSEVIKDVGTAINIDDRHNVSNFKGTHGLGHVRLATESRVDISHSHPFWAYPFTDVTVVHNGQLTNYHKMKRSYEDRGYHFQTGNDSELIAVYLAEKLSKGVGLEEVLEGAVGDLDGTFTFLVSTEDGLGYAKDQWSAKPLVIMETDELVAIASEEVALRRVFPQEIERIEPQQNEVKTWSI